MSKQKIEGDYVANVNQLDAKGREETRALQTIQFSMNKNSQVQRQLNVQAEQKELDLRAKQMEDKLRDTSVKRQATIDSKVRVWRDTRERTDLELTEKFRSRALDEKDGQQLDCIKHLERIVNKDDETEKLLYDKVSR